MAMTNPARRIIIAGCTACDRTRRRTSYSAGLRRNHHFAQGTEKDMHGSAHKWTAEIKALGDEIAALTVREAGQLALYLQTQRSTEQKVNTPQTIALAVASYEIALGLTDHLTTFRNAVAPDAAIYFEWHQKGLTSASDFMVGFQEVARDAKVIHFNIQGLGNIADALDFGRRGLDRIPAGFASNITNCELFTLSLWASAGNGIETADQIRAKLRWYNGPNPVEQPIEFLAIWQDD